MFTKCNKICIHTYYVQIYLKKQSLVSQQNKSLHGTKYRLKMDQITIT